MKKIVTFFLVGLLWIGLSSIAGAEEWQRVKLVDNMDISIELPDGAIKKIWERVDKKYFKSQFQSKDQSITVRVIAYSSTGILNKEEANQFPMDRWTHTDKLYYLESQKPTKQQYLTHLEFGKLKNGHWVMRGNLDKMPGNEMTLLHQGQSVTIQIIYTGPRGEPAIEALNRLRDSLEFEKR